MTEKSVQLSVTLPSGMHDRVREAARKRRDDDGRRIAIGEIYAAAIAALSARLDRGEEITFAAHPRGGVCRHSIRVAAPTAAQATSRLATTTQSSFVATAVRHYFKEKTNG